MGNRLCIGVRNQVIRVTKTAPVPCFFETYLSGLSRVRVQRTVFHLSSSRLESPETCFKGRDSLLKMTDVPM